MIASNGCLFGLVYKLQHPSESLLYLYTSKLVKLCTTYVERMRYCLSSSDRMFSQVSVCPQGKGGKGRDGCSPPSLWHETWDTHTRDMRPGILNPTPDRILTPTDTDHSGGHWNTCGWQVVGTHPTGILSCLRLCFTTFESLCVWFAVLYLYVRTPYLRY